MGSSEISAIFQFIITVVKEVLAREMAKLKLQAQLIAQNNAIVETFNYYNALEGAYGQQILDQAATGLEAQQQQEVQAANLKFGAIAIGIVLMILFAVVLLIKTFK